MEGGEEYILLLFVGDVVGDVGGKGFEMYFGGMV